MSDFTDTIKSVLPWIGTALGGPLGAGVATFVASKLGVPAEDVTNTLTAMAGNPEQVEKLKELDIQFQEHMAEIGYKSLADLEELNTRQLEAVNKTMQTEAAAEHWPTYSWRPFNGFLFGISIFCIYVVLPMFHIIPPVIPSEVWIGWSGILGVASFFRGKAQADPAIPAAVQIPAEHKVLNAILPNSNK